MTSRELVKSSLEFRNTHGRAARDMWDLFWAHIYHGEALKHIREVYPSDFCSGLRVDYAERSAVEQGNAYEIGTYIDPWGCCFTNIQRGVVGEVKTPLVTDDAWEDTSRVVFPEHWLSFDPAQVNVECAKTDKWIGTPPPRPFEQLQFIRGTANLYMDLMDPPKGFLDFLERMHDFYCRLLRKWAQTDVDCLNFMDDWGSQKSLLISPQLWRKYFRPMYQDYIDIAHNAGKKSFMHSDGNTLSILPDLVEMGLDAINTQIFCIGIDKLAPFKGKITFWGEICRQQLLPYGTVAEVEKAVEQVFDTLWDNGGCIAQCEFGAGARPENVEAVFRTWDRLTEGR